MQNQYQRRTDLIPNLVATVQVMLRKKKRASRLVVEERAKATQIKLDASDLTDPAKVKAFPRRGKPTHGGRSCVDYWPYVRTIPT